MSRAPRASAVVTTHKMDNSQCIGTRAPRLSICPASLIHRLFYYQEQYQFLHLPETEAYADRELTLPLHPKLEDRDAEAVANAFAALCP
jgi:dTDP-4-amino-4,6-dideoxygalactose transaminase